MRRYLTILIATILFGGNVMAQEPHTVKFTMNQIIGNSLTFCDYDSITGIIIAKDTLHTGPAVWIIPGYDYVFNDSVVITNENHVTLIYIEMDSVVNLSDGQFHHFGSGQFVEDCEGNTYYASDETYRRDTLYINILQNSEMPAPRSQDYWLSEGVVETLIPTPEDQGYFYVWESDNWDPDSLYVSYTLQITQPGYYKCNLWDPCLHHSWVEYFIEYAPSLKYVTTNLQENGNELHWTQNSHNTYDSVAIFRDFQFVALVPYETCVWTDTVNNEYGAPIYTLRPVKNGVIMEGRSKHKSGVSLSLHHVYQETIDISFYGPDQEGTSLGEYIQYYQLYSVEYTGWGLIRSEIPINVNDLYDIENLYDTLVIAAVTFDGQEIYSNMIFPAEITSLEENEADRVQIFPNPVFNDILCVSNAENAEYVITNSQGQQVQNGNTGGQVNIGKLSAGTYIITIKTGSSTTTTKFVKGR